MPSDRCDTRQHPYGTLLAVRGLPPGMRWVVEGGLSGLAVVVAGGAIFAGIAAWRNGGPTWEMLAAMFSGVVAAALCILGAWRFAVEIAFHETGLVETRTWRKRCVPYADLVSLRVITKRQYVYGVDAGASVQVQLRDDRGLCIGVGFHGPTAPGTVQVNFAPNPCGGDHAMDAVIVRISKAIAERLLRESSSGGVIWGPLRLHEGGIEVVERNAPVNQFRWSELSHTSWSMLGLPGWRGLCTLELFMRDGREPVAKLTADMENFHPGFALMERFRHTAGTQRLLDTAERRAA
jgi:hypothetical protein